MRLPGLFFAVILLAGCGGGDRSEPAPPGKPAPAARTTTGENPPAPSIVRARCPAGAANCAAATGRIVFLESVDADGDGDLHLVIAGGGVSGPGFSVLDIGKHLRPRRDPRVGDLASAAGPVYTGSYGQRQIEATVLHLARR